LKNFFLVFLFTVDFGTNPGRNAYRAHQF